MFFPFKSFIYNGQMFIHQICILINKFIIGNIWFITFINKIPFFFLECIFEIV